MTTQGRGSADQALPLAMVILCILVQWETAAAASTYTVGENGGWTFNSLGWPNGKRFRAGDVLVFRYNPKIHNVVAVNGVGYNSCKTPRGSRVYSSGNDQITLRRGRSFFICNFVSHCESGMKIAVTAA